MSSSPILFVLSLAIFSSLLLQGTLGAIICEDLPREVCSFSIASSGKRCLLENNYQEKKQQGYECITSQVMVGRGILSGYMETDECIKACGLDRSSVGISSDTMLDAQSVSNICSTPCYKNCPNIIDLYVSFAAAEGVVLGDLCEKQRSQPHRFLSSGDAAAASPVASQTQTHGASLYNVAEAPV